MPVSWVRVDLDDMGRWLSRLLELSGSRDGLPELRAELTANLMAAAARDGTGGSFVASAVARTSGYMAERASRLSAAGAKGAAARWGGRDGR